MTLTEALKAAAEAHHAFEAANGPDKDWPAWYANHMLSNGVSMASGPVSIWYEDDKQLGLSITLPDGRMLSIDLHSCAHRGSVLLVNNDGSAVDLWATKQEQAQ